MINVKTSERFERVLNKLDNSIKIQVDKLIIKLIDNPEIGKPMRYNRIGTREVYVGSYRFSYSYDIENSILYLLDIYHKDEQ